jgi:hypothetical protein
MQFLGTPRNALLVASVLPVLLARCVVFVVYMPGLPGSPPRSIGRILFWLPSAAAVVLLQLFPFGSWVLRALASWVFGGAMFCVSLIVFFFGACSFGDCM